MSATFIDAEGSIFDSGAQALVNPVNCVGVSGKGLALEFRKRFPENQKEYEDACGRGALIPGGAPVYWHSRIEPLAVVNFPTKRHWREASRLDDIRYTLREMAWDIEALRRAKMKTLRSIAFPALGCGLGGLDWKDVRPLIVEALRDIDGLTVYLYGPQEKKCP